MMGTMTEDESSSSRSAGRPATSLPSVGVGEPPRGPRMMVVVQVCQQSYARKQRGKMSRFPLSLTTLLQQHHHQQGSVVQNSQSSTVQQQQIGHGLGLSAQSISSAGPISQQQQQVQSVGLDSGSQQVLVSALSLKDNDAKSMRLEDNQMQQQPQKLPDESIDDSATNSGYTRSFMNDDDLKNSYTFDVPVVGPGSLAELSQLSKDADLSPGQQVQSVQPIGRRSASDLGAIGDNLVGSGAHDTSHNLQMLDAAYYRLPHPKDHERAKTYEPKHPVATPPSYPQTPAPIFDNPAFWERVDPDTLFFAFYHQQNTYQQYLAARELKRQSWRYHRKYNTWFQRHAEPKVTNDDYEKGTYVYFDFNIQDDFQQGWCQRIKTEFTFEYSYLEDELVV